MGRVWLQWNFPSRLASASTQGPIPTFGERGTRRLCRSEDIFVKSVSPSTFSGVPETKVISPTCTPSTCCMGSCFPCGQASYLGGFLLVGNGQQAGVSVICAHTGVTFLPSLLCLTPSSLLWLPPLQSSPFCTNSASEVIPNPLCVGIIGAHPRL